jgi:hypothetical protein
MVADPLPPELLAAWLDASDEAARQVVLDAYAQGLGADGARALLDLAGAGPSYGGDAERERALQRMLLELARGVAEHVGAAVVAAEACRLLAALVEENQCQAWLERAARHAIEAAAWELLAGIERELAGVALAARRPREAVAAAARALAACRHDLTLLAAGDAAADELVDLATRLGDPRTAWGHSQDWLAHVRRGGDLLTIARAAERVGGLAANLGRTEDAERWLGEAAAIYGELLDERALAGVLLRRLAIAANTGDLDEVARRAAEVLALRERTQDPAVRELLDES